MNDTRFVLYFVAAAVCLPCFSGCATILSDRTYPVTVDNGGDMNQGAQIAANDVRTVGNNPEMAGELVEQVGFQGQPETVTL